MLFDFLDAIGLATKDDPRLPPHNSPLTRRRESGVGVGGDPIDAYINATAKKYTIHLFYLSMPGIQLDFLFVFHLFYAQLARLNGG